jgi:hypothetical protein
MGRLCGVVTRPTREPALLPIDVAFGIAVQARDTVATVGRPLRVLAGPVVRVALRPPLVPRRLQPASWLNRVARRGATYRSEVALDLDALMEQLLPTLVAEIVRHVDVTELVQENVDVVTLARDVIAEIDLPEIIRDSTGAMASDTLLGVRMQSISGDDAIARAVDRLRLRLTRGAAVVPDTAVPVPAPGETVVVSPGPDPPTRTRL